MKISHFAVRHPAVILMLLVVLVAFGLYSLSGINTEFMGDLSLPSIIVVSIYPGANAQDVEEDVTNPLENEFVTLPDFKKVESVSGHSVSMITITFRDGIDPYDRLGEVRQRITQKMSDLPEGLQGTPNALVGGATMIPLFSFSVEGGNDIGRLTDYIENILKPRLTAISGVAEVNTYGGRKLQASVRLRLDDLAAKGVSALTVYQSLKYGNVNLPSGSVEYDGRVTDVRYAGGFNSVSDIGNLPVGRGEGSAVIYLRDVADITLEYPDPDYHVTNGQKPIIVIEVTKRTDGNTVKIAEAIRTVISSTEEETGGTVRCSIISDDSQTVNAALKTVIISGISGVLMAIAVIFLFLNDLRTTLIISLSIPLSILFAFIGLRVMGITMNLLSLSGLVISLGMVVDGSIVMIEQVYRYYRSRTVDGVFTHTAEQAIFTGSDEVGSAIMASILTTVAVFVPIALLPGIVGMILKDVAVTIIMSLIASGLVAVIVVPFLMSRILKIRTENTIRQTFFSRFIDKFEVLYNRALNWALRSWKFILTISLGVLVLSVFLMGALGLAFIPATDNGDFYINMTFPQGYSLDRTHRKMQQAGKLLEQTIPEIRSAAFYSGISQATLVSSSAANASYAHVVLVPVAERKRSVHNIILESQRLLSATIPDATVKVTNGGFDRLVGFVAGGGGYGMTLISEDLDLLFKSASRLEDFLAKDPDVVTVSLDTSYDASALVIDMSREYLGSLGVTSYEAGLTSNIIFMGIDTGRFRNAADGNRYGIRLLSDVTDRTITGDLLSNIQVVSSMGTPISFANISSLKTEQSISQINHTDRAKTITVSATLIGEDTSGVSGRVNDWLAKNPLPPGVSSASGGITQLLNDSIPPMLQGLAIAWFLVYTVMVLQFERFRQPFLVMATIPFCLIGVVAGLLSFGSTMSMIALLGVISLGGVVVNNGIILIDYINQLRSRKTDSANSLEGEIAFLKECICSGSASRIRPIFMTTLTTMLGVVPMAIARGEGAEIYAPLGQAIAGGLFTSTLITLFIIPVLYYLAEKAQLMRNYAKKGPRNTISDSADGTEKNHENKTV